MLTLFAILLAVQVNPAPDLVVTAVALNADGNFTFTVTNRGGAITQPFKVDASLDGYLRQTLQFQPTRVKNGPPERLPDATRLPFGNGEERHFILPNVKV